MLKRVVTYKGFWKSVIVLSFVYALVLFLLRWGFSGFTSEVKNLSASSYLVFLLCGFVASVFVTFGKYWAKLKREDQRK